MAASCRVPGLTMWPRGVNVLYDEQYENLQKIQPHVYMTIVAQRIHDLLRCPFQVRGFTDPNHIITFPAFQIMGILIPELENIVN